MYTANFKKILIFQKYPACAHKFPNNCDIDEIKYFRQLKTP